jgi:GT2 family glycosyltransferase
MRLSDGTQQNPYFVERPSRRKILLTAIVWKYALLAFLLRRSVKVRRGFRNRLVCWNDGLKEKRFSPPSSKIKEIYAAHGSAVFLSERFFARGASLCYDGFMFGEELYLAEQARNTGLKVLWVPELRIIHHEHNAIRGVSRRQIRRWARESSKMIWENYFKTH